MYVYAFERRFGHDKIAELSGVEGKPGDLLKSGDEYFLILGDHISFSELSCYVLRLNESEIVVRKLLSTATLDLLHWFVNNRFTTYKSAIPLRCGNDAQQILFRETKAKRKSSKSVLRGFVDGDVFKLSASQDTEGQQLIVFPNMYSLQIALDNCGEIGDDVAVLKSQMTVKQKYKAFRNIKNGNTKTVLATYSQIFQDRKDLKSIIVLDQHKRYYKNPKEPRYHAVTCLDKMGEEYGVEVMKTGFTLGYET